MSKWIKCTVTATKVLMIERKDSDGDPGASAVSIAINEAFEGHFDDVTSLQITDENIESEKRHADQVITLD